MRNYFQLYRSKLYLGCLLPILLAVLLFVAGTVWLIKTKPFRNAGIEKLAIVKEINPRPNNGAELSYYYWDDNSKSHEFRAVVPSQWKLFADNNRQVPITYLPEDPNRHMIGGVRDIEKEAAPGEYMRMAAAFLIFWALGFFGFLYIKLKRIFDVVRTGITLPSTVAEWGRSSTSSEKPDQLKYHFNGADGRWYEGRSLALPENVLTKFPPGTRITICFDAANPSFHQVDIFGLRKKK